MRKCKGIILAVMFLAVWVDSYALLPRRGVVPAGCSSAISTATSESPSAVVTTVLDVVDPDDGEVSLREAMLYAIADPTLGGVVTFALPDPFLVMATQNPIEQEGTYQLPEAQVDRFMLKAVIDYPTIQEERLIIRENLHASLPEVKPVTTAEEIIDARAVVRQVYLDEKIEQYIADIVFATRYPDHYQLNELRDFITFGGSPRASISLAKAARAYAFIKRRGYVVPEDVRAVAHDVLRHRIGLSYEAEASNVNSEEIISKIINKVEVP